MGNMHDILIEMAIILDSSGRPEWAKQCRLVASYVKQVDFDVRRLERCIEACLDCVNNRDSEWGSCAVWAMDFLKVGLRCDWPTQPDHPNQQLIDELRHTDADKVGGGVG